MAARKFEFDALIKKHGKTDGGFIEFPWDVQKEFGKGRVKVMALFDGLPYRGSLVKMGGDCHWLGITKELRKSLGKNPGDTIHVVITEDKEERSVEIPDDLNKELKKHPDLLSFFNGLAYTHRKEYVRWITEAKKEETRKNRVIKAIELLTAKAKNPSEKKEKGF
jgi:hypothetical protein